MRRPSWKISVESEALEPATRPPMSVWWQMVAAKATRRPSWKMGLRMNTSGRCMPPSNGSFSAKTSPGRIRSPYRRITAASASGNEERWPGSVRPCATVRPSASQKAVE